METSTQSGQRVAQPRLVRHLDLFSGIGGFALAARMVGGIKTIGFSEINTYASSILKQHWPDVPNLGDIRNVWGIKCDLITGGFPCQDICRCGSGEGIGGKRSGLWSEMARIVSEVRPRYVFIENAPQLVKRGLAVVLCDLAEMGYDARWGIVGAHHVAAPHKRDRIWIVASSNAGYSQSPERQDKADTSEGAEGGDETRDESAPFRWWASEPGLERVGDGVAHLMDRTRCVGNGQVPAVAALAWEILGENKNVEPDLTGSN
jgi:DNA (cytosine-5)-methyltransferase 1